MKKIILFLFISINISCSDNTGFISDMEYVIFQSVDYPKFEGYTNTNLSHNEVKKIEHLIKKELEKIQYFHEIRIKENITNTEYENIKGQLTFVRQYSAFINKDSKKKIIIIRFMCNPKSKYETFKNNWKTEPLGNILDGGSCYFSFTVNFTDKTLIDTSINTVAQVQNGIK